VFYPVQSSEFVSRQIAPLSFIYAALNRVYKIHRFIQQSRNAQAAAGVQE